MSIHRISSGSKLCASPGTTWILAWVGIPHITVRPRFSLWTSGMGRVDQAALHPLWPRAFNMCVAFARPNLYAVLPKNRRQGPYTKMRVMC